MRVAPLWVRSHPQQGGLRACAMAPHHSLPSSSPLAACPPPNGCQTCLRKRSHLASDSMLALSGTATLLQSPEGERSPQSVVGDVFAESLQSNDTSSRFASLKLSCAVEFDERFHKPLLRELWQSAFPHIPFERISTCWEELGFQSVEPTKDLRGAGVTGLSHLLHFCSSSGNLEMVRRGNSQFPLAVASLNVTLILCAHLNLLSLPSSGACKIARCSESTLRNFMRLHDSCAKNTRPDGRLMTSSTCLDLIHEQSLRWLLDRWEELGSTSPEGPRLLQMPRLLFQLCEHIRCVFQRVQAPWSLCSILVALRECDTHTCCLMCNTIPSMSRMVSMLLPGLWQHISEYSDHQHQQ